MNCCWVYRKGRTRAEEEVAAGRKSTEFWYGYKSLPAAYSGCYIEDGNEWGSRLLGSLDSWVVKRLGMGFAMGTAATHWKAVRDADVIVTTQDSGGLPFAWLKAKGLIKAKLVYISQGLTDRVELLGPEQSWLKNQLRESLLAADVILVWGEGAIPPLQEWLGPDAPEIEHVPFGVNTDFWTPPAAGTIRHGAILSVGSDPWRDYETLLDALPDRNLELITRLPVDLSRNPEARKIEVETDGDLRGLLQHAQCVVVPVKDVAQPSGQSSVLQAMACGAPVIMTRSRGFWAGGILEDGKHCLMVPPEDSGALRRAVERVCGDSELAERLGWEGRRRVEALLSEKVMAEAIRKQIEKVITDDRTIV